jgi:hypothetical protein
LAVAVRRWLLREPGLPRHRDRIPGRIPKRVVDATGSVT